MNYKNINLPQFEELKKQALADYKSKRYPESLEGIMEAALVAAEYLPGYFTDQDFEQTLGKIGEKVLEQNKIDLTKFNGKSSRCEILHIASYIGYVGGHSELVRQWISVLKDGGLRQSLFCTQLIKSVYPIEKIAELLGDGENVAYAEENTIVKSMLNLANFIKNVNPKLIVLFTNPHDVIATSIISTLKGKIPLIVVNHADMTFWLGSSSADLVVEFRKVGEYFTRHFRGVKRTKIIPLTSKLPLVPEAKKANRVKIRKIFDIPETSTLSLSITTLYKILGSSWSYLDTIIELLFAHPDHHHIFIVSSGQDQVRQYIRGSGVESRFHILDRQEDLIPYYQGADFLIETFPYKGGMVQCDAFKAGLPTVIVENPHIPEHSILQGLPEGYPQATNKEELLEIAGNMIQSEEYRESLSRALYSFYQDNFSQETIAGKIKALVSQMITKQKIVYDKPLEKLDSNFHYIYLLGHLKSADEDFLFGKNDFSLPKALQHLVDSGESSEDLRAVTERLKYNHVNLDYQAREDYKAGILAMEKKKYGLAVQKFQKVVNIDPCFPLPYKYLGECYVYMNQCEEALSEIASFLTFAKTKESIADGCFIAGSIKKKQQDYQGAVSAYLDAHQQWPENRQILEALARAYAEAQQFGKAIEALDQLLATGVKDYEFLYNIILLRGEYAEQIPHRFPGNLDWKALKSQGIKTSIIIPVFNKAGFTRNCLETIYQVTPLTEGFEVIVVDNGSQDETGDYLKQATQQYLNLKVITNPENLGFSRACNIGAQQADGEYLLFLNNDTTPTKGWLSALTKIGEQDDSVGCVGSKLLFADGAIQHAGVAIVEDCASGDPLLPTHNFYRGMGDVKAQLNSLHRFQALTAACLLIRKSVFETLQGFDETYWNGYEDVDFCFRAGEKGLQCIYQPESVLYHYESQSGLERFAKVDHNIKVLHQRWLGKVTIDFVHKQDGNYHKTSQCSIKTYRIPKKRKDKIAEKAAKCPAREPQVSVVILTYNQLNRTKECLQSMAESHDATEHEVIIVDNGSTDGTTKYLKQWVKQKPYYKIILNNDNKGFSGGNNQGIRKARGQYILLMNNDVVVPDKWLEAMLRAIKKDATIGVLGPMSNYVRGMQLVENTDYNNMKTFQEFARKRYQEHRGYVQYVHRLVGFCMMIKREVIDKIGVLDERFGKGNFEDDDFCLRAVLANYKLAIAKDVFIHHYGNSTFDGNNIDYAQSILTNQKIFVDKWNGQVNEHPLWINILLEKAKSEGEIKDFTAQEETLQLLFEHNPGHKKVVESYEKFLREQNKHSRIIPLLEKYLSKHPDDPEGQNTLGVYRWEIKDIPKAIDAFAKAVQLDEKCPEYLKNLADACLEEERFEEAVTYYVQLIEKFPSDIEGYQKLAGLYLEDANYESAKSLLSCALQIEPQNKSLRDWLDLLRTPEVYMAHNLIEEGRFDAATNLLQKVYTDESKYFPAEGYIMLGSLYRIEGKEKEADDCFATAIEMDPENEKIKELIVK